MAMKNNLGKLSLKEIILKTYTLEGGTKTFYRGQNTAIIGIIIYKGSGFMLFEYIKPEITNKFKNYDNNNSYQNSINFIAGASAGLLSQLAAYPFDIQKKKLQGRGSFASPDFEKTKNQEIDLKTLVKTIYKEEGLFRGFYKGYSQNMNPV